MKLKAQIVLVLVLVIALIAVGLGFQQIRAIRNSIAVETETAGFVIYRTPATSYLEDTNVPEWFTRAVSPKTEVREFQIQGAKLLVRTKGSRAISRAWQEFQLLFVAIVAGFVVMSLLAWWLVDRALRPFDKVTTALRAVGQGDYQIRLPELRGAEAKVVGQSFNHMVSNLSTSMAAIEAEAIAKSELQKNRELTQAIRQRIENEHRALAHELHDELGQHVTAIKSMGTSIVRRDTSGGATAKTAGHIVESANSIHAAIRHMLVHLRPASLDQFGLVDALEDLVSDWGVKHPAKTFNLNYSDLPEKIHSELSTVTYRIAQEALTNAIRHSGADRINVQLDADTNYLYLSVKDNGHGINPEDEPGFGITGMKERATAISGTLSVTSDTTGCTVSLQLPFHTSQASQLQKVSEL